MVRASTQCPYLIGVPCAWPAISVARCSAGNAKLFPVFGGARGFRRVRAQSPVPDRAGPNKFNRPRARVSPDVFFSARGRPCDVASRILQAGPEA
eukprot:6588062-Pyramimonas_sp.AAC.1